jgi:Protein of unknown function (DUF4241)
MAWPQDYWYALADDTRIKVRFDDPYVGDPDVLQLWRLHVVDGGVLRVPSGWLGIADPGYDLRGRTGRSDLGEVQIPPGSHPVRVTQADISRRDPGSPVLDTRAAYVSVLLGAGAEVRRRKLALVPQGQAPPLLADDEFIGFGVDGGTACLVDAQAAQRSYPTSMRGLSGTTPRPGRFLAIHPPRTRTDSTRCMGRSARTPSPARSHARS